MHFFSYYFIIITGDFMRYLIFSDLANTLCNNFLEFSLKQIEKINNLITNDCKLIILTEEPFESLDKIIKANNIGCDYYSASSLIGFINNNIIDNKIELDSIKFIFEKYKKSIYTSCLMYKNNNNVINHLDRLESFYPSNYEIINNPILPPSEVLIAIDNNNIESLKEDIERLSLKYIIIGSDLKRTIIKIAKITPTKEAILKSLIDNYPHKKTIGIGDSYCDYSFIKHCDIKISVGNDKKLNSLCDYNYQIDELIDKLYDICHFKKV